MPHSDAWAIVDWEGKNGVKKTRLQLDALSGTKIKLPLARMAWEDGGREPDAWCLVHSYSSTDIIGRKHYNKRNVTHELTSHATSFAYTIIPWGSFHMHLYLHITYLQKMLRKSREVNTSDEKGGVTTVTPLPHASLFDDAKGHRWLPVRAQP